MKHPKLGNLHLQDSEQSEREAQGWVRWPRTAEQKAGLQPQAAAPVSAPKAPASDDSREPSPSNPPDRDECLRVAESLGVKVDRRWGDKRLRKEIGWAE